MKAYAPLLALALLASACAPAPLAQYRPIVDPAAPASARYESDLRACQNIAIKAKNGYMQSEQSQMAKNTMAGVLIGAVAGAALGDSGRAAGIGASYGAFAGAAGTETPSSDGTPQHIIDRCMEGRGHQILGDFGRG